MSSRRDDQRNPDVIPEIVTDPQNQKKYEKGRFLGKGGFARCYELKEKDTDIIMAGKIVPKTLLTKAHQKEKMTQEISIHRSLDHKHIVSIFGFFEDQENVYVLLELCRRRSLMELHKRRKIVTEAEARYFVLQIAVACQYLHSNNIIHRDLKLGNLFLNDDMEVKIGDFGLATKVDFAGERKKTLCGTPNYIAPEILGKKGHSFEVDVWSLGCILFTLLVGKPPFETSNLKDTYARIKRNEYFIPPDRMSPQARNLTQKLLQADPDERPSMTEVIAHEFFSTGILPQGLPTSCLSTAPRLDLLRPTRRPLTSLTHDSTSNQANTAQATQQLQQQQRMEMNSNGLRQMQIQSSVGSLSDESSDHHLTEMFSMLTTTLASPQIRRPNSNEEEAEDPAAIPIFWVSKWVDYSDKYGLGYQLCDNSLGVLFNDSSRLLLTSNGDNMQYIEKEGTESLHSLTRYPETLSKKVTLLKYFKNYMNDHLLKAGANINRREGEEMTRLPFLRTWFRTRSAIVLHLSNGTLQINFFDDHTKLILCPLMAAVTYIDSRRSFRTYRLPLIERHGCNPELMVRLSFALSIVKKLKDSVTK